MRQIEGSDAAAFAALFYTEHLFEHIDGAEGAEGREEIPRFPLLFGRRHKARIQKALKGLL